MSTDAADQYDFSAAAERGASWHNHWEQSIPDKPCGLTPAAVSMYLKTGKEGYLFANSWNYNSQQNTSGRKPRTCDTPVSHSIDTPTEEFKSIAIIGTLGFLTLYPLRLASTCQLLKFEMLSLTGWLEVYFSQLKTIARFIQSWRSCLQCCSKRAMNSV